MSGFVTNPEAALDAVNRWPWLEYDSDEEMNEAEEFEDQDPRSMGWVDDKGRP